MNSPSDGRAGSPLTFHAGDTFLFPLQSPGEIAHLWVVATEPGADGQFVAVNFTSLRGAKDQTVVIRAGEHPFVTHDTCVLYSAADLTDCARVEARVRRGDARLHLPVTPELLSLVLSGFAASDFTKNRIREFVRQHRASQRTARASGPTQ